MSGWVFQNHSFAYCSNSCHEHHMLKRLSTYSEGVYNIMSTGRFNWDCGSGKDISVAHILGQFQKVFFIKF